MSRIIHTPLLWSLLVLVGFSSFSLAQPAADSPPPGQELSENRMLIAFNRADLSLEQLQALQTMVQATIQIQDTLLAAQQAFQDFLVSWTGTSEDFQAALEQEQQKLKDILTTLHELWKSNAEAVKNMLSANQFEALAPVLTPVMGPPAPARPAKVDKAKAGQPDKRGPDVSKEIALLRGLDLLSNVLNEKIAALQNQ